MVELRWLGQMGLMVKTGKTTICIDYYATDDKDRQTPVPVPAGELKGIDAFLGTHDHLDHIDHEAWKIWAKTAPEAKFVFPELFREKVRADGVDEKNALGMNAGDTLQIGDITVHAIPAAHEFLDKDLKTGFYPFLQYIIETEGIKIHHAGDTVRYEGMFPAIKSFGDIDVQLLPINGRDAKRYSSDCIGNMTFQEAADLAGETESRLVIPGHWDMFAHNSADPEEFKAYLDVKYKGRIKCIIPKVMEKITVG